MLKARSRQNILQRILAQPGFVVTLIVLAGIMFAPSQMADVSGIKSGSVSLFSSGKTIRLITVLFAGFVAMFFASRSSSRTMTAMISGNNLLLTLYALLATFTVIFSHLMALTLFKSFELFVASLVAALIITTRAKEDPVIFYLKGLFWIYVLSTITALTETILVGPSHHKQLVGETPLLTTMMQSTFPPMVGNALGYLGALVGLFGIYLFDASDIKGKKRKIIAFAIFVCGSIVLFLSYTRSILVFFGVCMTFYFFINKKYLRVGIIVFTVVAALLTPPVQEKIYKHMQRGMSDQQISSLSGRTDFWTDIFSRDPLTLLVGKGFGTGTRLQDSGETFIAANAHNSIAEIMGNSGLLGLAVWLILIVRIGFQMLKIRRKLMMVRIREAIIFHRFMMAVYGLSVLRTFMNSSFVYVDYFLFLLIGMAVYAETYSRRPLNRFASQ